MTPPSTLVDDVIVLLVSVCVSVSPTMVPEGAVTTDNTPEASLAMPEEAARFSVLPPIPENRASSESTEEAGPSNLSAFRFAKLVLMSARELPTMSVDRIVTIVEMGVYDFG